MRVILHFLPLKGNLKWKSRHQRLFSLPWLILSFYVHFGFHASGDRLEQGMKE
jgi:hypothetical protein